MPICDLCWSELSADAAPSCARCGDRLDLPPDSGYPGANLCRVCRLAPPPFVRAVAYSDYRERMRGAIHALKYDGLRPAARPLGHMLAQAIAKLASEAPAEMLVVPIPLHRSKFRQRGFNQARILAVYALESLRSTHPDWKLELASRALLRQRATENQAGLTSRQRRLNVRGAFQVTDAEAVTARNVLLVDDIFTTGATARAAAQALARAGAATVWVATLARAGHADTPSRGDRAAFDLRKETVAAGVQASGRQGSLEFIDSLHDQTSF